MQHFEDSSKGWTFLKNVHPFISKSAFRTHSMEQAERDVVK